MAQGHDNAHPERPARDAPEPRPEQDAAAGQPEHDQAQLDQLQQDRSLPAESAWPDRRVIELAQRIADAVEHPETLSFDELSQEVVACQLARLEPLQQLYKARGQLGTQKLDWRQVPPVPVVAFKSLRLSVLPGVEVFRTSGTSSAAEGVARQRGEHHQPFPELYRRIIDSSFPAACLPSEHGEGEHLPILSLIPSRELVPDSSLGFMADHILQHWGDEALSCVALDQDGVLCRQATNWARQRQHDGKPGLILATAFALADWLESLEDEAEPVRLPAASVLFETGGFKGRRRELSREQLLAGAMQQLGLGADRVVREYGMTELTSQCYPRTLVGGDPDLFFPPPWMRVRILDPRTLAELPAGESGLIAPFDLGNVGSVASLLTQDLGVAEGAGFRLLGRAGDAELRGCSLTVEELHSTEDRGAPG